MKTNVLCVACLCLLLAVPATAGTKAVRVTVTVDSQAPGYEGARAMDGNPSSMWHTRFGAGETNHPHEMTIDLGKSYAISGIAYRPRAGAANGTIKDYEIYVGDDPKKLGKPVAKGAFPKRDAETVVTFAAKAQGRYLRVKALSEVSGRPWTSIAELRILSDGVVFQARNSTETLALPQATEEMSEPDREFAALRHDLRNQGHWQRVAAQALRPEATILAADRDPADVVLRRTAALAADLKSMPEPPDLTALEAEFARLQAAGKATDVADADARRKLFDQARALRRKIAFANPLLSFDKLLFAKRHRSTFNHMCDQYYGINSVPGGGLYVLAAPFGAEPKVTDVLANVTVKAGRLKGKKLEGGCLVSPDLSHDAKKIAFAYVECQGDRGHRHHTDPSRGHWHEGRCYHIFTVNIDPSTVLRAGGSDLAQITDGTWNDFDPCWLPNGRLAFITERRGGYLRCGRVCPTYTLYDMAADGSDIRGLSPHETNEWHPSVTHDGRIIYTRWDYIDRHGCTAHLPWITTVDGRDSRALHGNFAPRNSRPDMELDIRAVPLSHKFVATAAPHHGQAYGSLVLIDPRIPDDDAMMPLKRVTPEIGFPESQGGAQVYATAWALSEHYYLCVYDAGMGPGVGRQGRRHVRGNYGIYLVDAFGNKELIYRDPSIACLSPIPLRPRPTPPDRPSLIAEWDEKKPKPATVAVLNVYDSLKPWPAGTQIKALRVIQVLPMSVPSGGPPHETGLRLPSAGDSVNPARWVLGSVPVEKDGSAHFTLPARKEVFFQALDAAGNAVQSMRSATYLQPGERLVCMGCHEPKVAAPAMPEQPPLALRRAPSKIAPDVDGSNPFSYPRLVQPVLDRKCQPCHEKKKGKAPRLDREIIGKGRKRFYASYHSLAPKYGFWNYGHGYRTTPGKFGAYASKLYAMLKKGHNDVKLTDEELHRIALWLDCSSLFYGVYEKEGGQAQLRGEVVRATLE